MDKETREALEGSIAKWQAIVEGTGVDIGTENCPLCKMFNNEEVEYDIGQRCSGCPVADKSGYSDCIGTPYDNWSNLFHKRRPWRAENEAQKAVAQAELDFLISLRPKEG